MNKMKKVKIIACCDINGLIGRVNTGGMSEIPWSYPEDQKRFKELTMGTTLIMGRKTYESLPTSKLPGRTIHVITRNYDYKSSEKDKVFQNMKDAIIQAKTDIVWIAGGAEIYQEALNFAMATEIDLTVIDGMHVLFDQIKHNKTIYFPPIPLCYVQTKNELNKNDKALYHRTYELMTNWYGGWEWEK